MKGGDNMQGMAHALSVIDQGQPRLSTVKTTLYELIEAISGQVKLEDYQLVTEVVLDLFETGQIRFLGSKEESAPLMG